MNIAVIFAGGSGQRMNTESCPKQFLKLNGKPIIIYTLELFDSHKEIDGIVVACLEAWIPYLKELVQDYRLRKVIDIVPGGETGQDSIYNGLRSAASHCPEDSVVLIHDGVRPLIDAKTISDNIRSVKEHGSAITCIPASETFVVYDEEGSKRIPSRNNSFIARAPQSFVLKDILSAHEMARAEGKHDYIDSCSMMNHYGHKLEMVPGPVKNIKITTPADFFIMKTMLEIHENYQIFGFKL